MTPPAATQVTPGAFRAYGIMAVVGVAALGFLSAGNPFWHAFVTAACLLALAIALRAASIHEARLLVVLLLSMVFAASKQPASPEWLWRIQTQAGWWASSAALLAFSAVFPHRLRPADLAPGRPTRTRRWVARVERLALRPSVVWSGATFFTMVGVFHDLSLRYGFVGRSVRVLYYLSVAAWLVMLLLALHFLIRGYRLSDGSQRVRAWWMVAGLGSALVALTWFIVLGMMAGMPRLPERFGTVLDLLSLAGLLVAPFLILGGIACAVFYRGALDPALMIRRTTVVSGLGMLLIVVFATLENVLTESVVRVLDLPPISGGLISGGALAVVVTTLQDRVRGWLSADPGSGTHVEPATGGAVTEIGEGIVVEEGVDVGGTGPIP